MGREEPDVEWGRNNSNTITWDATEQCTYKNNYVEKKLARSKPKDEQPSGHCSDGAYFWAPVIPNGDNSCRNIFQGPSMNLRVHLSTY